MIRLKCEDEDYQYNLDHPNIGMIKTQTATQAKMADTLSSMEKYMEEADKRRMLGEK